MAKAKARLKAAVTKAHKALEKAIQAQEVEDNEAARNEVERRELALERAEKELSDSDSELPKWTAAQKKAMDRISDLEVAKDEAKKAIQEAYRDLWPELPDDERLRRWRMFCKDVVIQSHGMLFDGVPMDADTIPESYFGQSYEHYVMSHA